MIVTRSLEGNSLFVEHSNVCLHKDIMVLSRSNTHYGPFYISSTIVVCDVLFFFTFQVIAVLFTDCTHLHLRLSPGQIPMSNEGQIFVIVIQLFFKEN